jgi:MFS family permease
LPPLRTGRRRLAVGAAGAAVLLGSIDAYVLVSVLVDMIGDLDIPVNHLERATPLVTGYLLGYIAGMPLLGRVSDRFGRRIVIHVCLAAFAVGSVVSAVSLELAPLVAGRALQGLAGGALLPVTMALAADLFTAERRAVVLGWVGAAQELGAVLGPLAGAGIAALVGWRGIFWINVPLAVLAALAVHFALPSAPQRRDARIDFLGGGLLAVALALFTVGLYNPEPEFSVLPAWGPATIAAGAAVLVVFALQQRFSRVRLLDPDGVRWGPYAACLAASAAAGAVLMVTLVDTQLLAQTLLGLDSGGGALLLSLFLVGLPLGALAGGVLASRFGERLPSIAGFATAAVAYVWIARTVPDVGPGLALAGLALGLTIAPLSSAALRAVPEDRHGTAAAFAVVARMMGMLIGVAALTSWSLNRFLASTADLDTPLPIGVTEAEYLERRADYLEVLERALAAQYADVFTAAAVICLAGAVVSAALPGRVRVTSAV